MDYLAIDSEYGDVSRIYKETGKITSPMGCRAYLSQWKDPETGETITIGRSNIGAVSLNLPLLWEIAQYEHPEAVEEYFFKLLDERMEDARQFHLRRYEMLSKVKCSTNPIMFTQGGLYKGTKHPDDPIGDLTNYMTASFGFVGLNELTLRARGMSIYENKSEFAEKVIDRMNENITRFKKEDNRGWALYATPAESYASTSANQVREYLISIGEKERALKIPEYFTNGFHLHVSEEITPFEKQDAEMKLFHKVNGGHIQYVRIDDPTNVDGIQALVERALHMGFYEGINHDHMVCDDCGEHSSPSGGNIAVCPKCGSRNVTTISRVCGLT